MRKYKKLEFNNFNNSSNINSVMVDKFYNYYPTTSLNKTYGIDNVRFPDRFIDIGDMVELNIADLNITSIDGVAYFRQYYPSNGSFTHRILVYCNDKKLYINEMFLGIGDLVWLNNFEFNSAPITLSFKKDDNDAIILASTDKMIIWETGYSPYTISNAPIITSMCMNEGVLFCTLLDPAFKIWFATDLTPEHVGQLSSNSGYIMLGDSLGDARKIVTFNEAVYIFRDYGISKITRVKGEIGVSQVYFSNTKIFTNTVSVCENAIIFLTRNGLYSFNGTKVSKMQLDLSHLLREENDNAVGASLGNLYYLALNLDFEDEEKILCENGNYKNNALVIIDINSLNFQIMRGVDVRQLLPVIAENYERMLLTFNSNYIDKVGEIIETPTVFNSPLKKMWLSKNLTDNFKTKVFTSLKVNADASIKFTLIHDNGELELNSYANGINEFCFKIISKQLKLKITSLQNNCKVENCVIEYYES